MAIEAVGQVTHTTKADQPSILLRHVNIIKALPPSENSDDGGCEVFTTMHAAKLSGTTVSFKWYDFEISTYDDEKLETVGEVGGIIMLY